MFGEVEPRFRIALPSRRVGAVKPKTLETQTLMRAAVVLAVRILANLDTQIPAQPAGQRAGRKWQEVAVLGAVKMVPLALAAMVNLMEILNSRVVLVVLDGTVAVAGKKMT